jgi:hypothetical protein
MIRRTAAWVRAVIMRKHTCIYSYIHEYVKYMSVNVYIAMNNLIYIYT